MTTRETNSTSATQEQWLKLYYFLRAVFSIVWVAAAFTAGQRSPTLAAILLVIYPAWDAAANYLDASRSGGLAQNRTQIINVIVSSATTLAVLLTLRIGMNAVTTVFGVWAILSGLLQLGTAIRRWKSYGAQWLMVLSGAQSALAGIFFIVLAQKPLASSVATVAGYAAVGALYFLISAVWLAVRELRRRPAQPS